ncbi:MAG: tetratricopeptide repeat protein [Deltaproteobacteria bacterium]|nr:tetratricopeptide repeat protein [Deltaproteobacteria bacterium]
MTNRNQYLFSRSVPIISSFLEKCFGRTNDLPLRTDPNWYVITEVHEVTPPDFTPSVVVDCHIGSRFISNPKLYKWFQEVAAKKITFDFKKSWCSVYDLRSFTLFQKALKEHPHKPVNDFLLVLGPWEFDRKLVDLICERAQTATIVLLDEIDAKFERPSFYVQTIDDLICRIKESLIVVNPAIETSFPLVELLSCALGRKIVTSCYGCSYEYLNDVPYYFKPYCQFSCATLSKSLGLNKEASVIQFSGNLEETIRTDLNMNRKNEEEIIDLVEELVGKGDFEGSIKLLLSELETNKSSARLRRALGLILLSQGKVDEAKQWLLESYVFEPDNPKTICAVGIMLMEQGHFEKAEEFFARSIDNSSQPLVPLFKLVELAYRTNRFDRAISALRNYLERTNYENIDLCFTLAGLLYKSEDYGASLMILDEIAKRKPDYESANVLRSLIMEKTSTSSNNIPVENSANGADETQEDNELLIVAEKMSDDNVEEKIRMAEKLKRHGDYSKAFEVLVEVYDKNLPTDILEKIQFLMVELKVLLGELKFFDTNYQYFEYTFPDNARWLGIKGTVALLREDLEASRKHFSRAVELDPNLDLAWAGLGLLAEFDGDVNSAREFYKKALRVNPINLRAILGLTDLLIRAGDYEEAKVWVKRFIELDSENKEVMDLWSKLGSIHSNGDFDGQLT